MNEWFFTFQWFQRLRVKEAWWSYHKECWTFSAAACALPTVSNGTLSRDWMKSEFDSFLIRVNPASLMALFLVLRQLHGCPCLVRESSVSSRMKELDLRFIFFPVIFIDLILMIWSNACGLLFIIFCSGMFCLMAIWCKRSLTLRLVWTRGIRSLYFV